MTIAPDGQTRNTARSGSHLRAVPTLAALPTPRSPKDGPIYCTICHRLRNACACQRCAVTGLPIDPTSYIMRIREPLHRAPARYLQEQDYYAPPQTLHIHPFHNGAEGVGMAYTVMLMRYLDAALDERVTEELREAVEWWASDYGIERVRRGLERTMSAARAAYVLDVVTTMHREEADPAEIADRFSLTAHRVQMWFKWCMDLALKRRAYPATDRAA